MNCLRLQIVWLSALLLALSATHGLAQDPFGYEPDIKPPALADIPTGSPDSSKPEVQFKHPVEPPVEAENKVQRRRPSQQVTINELVPPPTTPPDVNHNRRHIVLAVDTDPLFCRHLRDTDAASLVQRIIDRCDSQTTFHVETLDPVATNTNVFRGSQDDFQRQFRTPAALLQHLELEAPSKVKKPHGGLAQLTTNLQRLVAADGSTTIELFVLSDFTHHEPMDLLYQYTGSTIRDLRNLAERSSFIAGFYGLNRSPLRFYRNLFSSENIRHCVSTTADGSSPMFEPK